MKPQPQSRPGMTSLPKNLHQLVGLAANNSMPAAVQRNSFIVNEVPREFQVATDEKVLSTLLNSLLSTIVTNTKHSCIRIKAKEYEDMVFLSVRDNSAFGNYSSNFDMEQVQMLAKKMNGNIRIESLENKFTVILLSYPNFPVAA